MSEGLQGGEYLHKHPSYICGHGQSYNHLGKVQLNILCKILLATLSQKQISQRQSTLV